MVTSYIYFQKCPILTYTNSIIDSIKNKMLTTNKLHTIELALLASLLISTPLSEALKNISWLFYVLTWITVRLSSTQNWGGEWKAWDTIFLIWISSGFVVAMLTTIHHQEWNGAWDVLRFAGAAWLVSRSNYSRSELTDLIGVAVLATVVGTAYAVWAWKIGHTRPNLEIHSVGFVNHTAIYLALACGSSLTFLISRIWSKHYTFFLAILITVISLTAATLITSARGSILSLFILIPILFIMLSERKIVMSILSVTILAIIIFGMYQLKLPAYNKFERIITHTSSAIGQRDVTADVALTIWSQHPIQGVGLENYGAVDNIETISRYMTNQGREPRKTWNGVLGSGHAHNLYTNTLAERGLIGFIPVILVLFYWAKSLVKYRPRSSPITDPHHTILWGSALTGWFVVTVNGVFNTTLHHEHGLLAAFFLATLISSIRGTKD